MINYNNMEEKRQRYYDNNKEKILFKMKEYYRNNKERIKEYQTWYYHKNKKLQNKTRINYFIKYYSNRILRNCEKVYILRDYNKNNYWNFIQETNLLWRFINENKLFTDKDKNYISKLTEYSKSFKRIVG